MLTRGRVLVVAGSDSGGGAGIQADIKTITALGGYAATAITALTAQNTRGVFDILEVPADFLRRQIDVVLSDLGADAIKTGMLHRAAAIETLCDALEAMAPRTPLVVDPVMAATSGSRLLDAAAIAVLRRRLMPRADVLTPNLPEAAVLLGGGIETRAAMREAASALRALGPRAVLLKGGHLQGETLVDILATPDGLEEFEAPRIDSRHTHGTGCTLASAVAVSLAQGLGLRDAVIRARAFVREAIRTAPGFGGGHGPLNHAHTVAPFKAG